MVVIESRTHGVFVGIDWSSSGNSYGPRFSYTAKRKDGWAYNTYAEAEKAIETIRNFKHYAWKRQSWIDEIYAVSI